MDADFSHSLLSDSIEHTILTSMGVSFQKRKGNIEMNTKSSSNLNTVFIFATCCY